MTRCSPSKTLSIDIETYSSEDLSSVGVYKYAAAPDFRVLLFACCWDGSEVELYDLTREELPEAYRHALASPDVEKHAFNAAFERVCLSRYLGLPEGEYLDPAQWRCTMVQASYFGAIGSLKNVGTFLKVEMGKDAAGTRLINKFSKPQKKQPAFKGEDWERFCAYCIRDVTCEMEIASKLPGALPEREQELYVADQRINDYGVLVDSELARAACSMADAEAARAKERLEEVTGLANPNSVAQLLPWLRSRGCKVGSCARDVLATEAAREACDPLAREAIELRLASAKSSVKKYAVARDAAGADGRLRGSFRFYGAATGRWAGRLMQLQNLPRGALAGESLDIARELTKACDADGLRMLFGDAQDTLKSLVRTVLVPPAGSLFAVSDFSAIEARVLAWLAGEAWALEVFRTTGKVYEATASRMFRVPIVRVDKDLRARGKVATLALGYQGGPAALARMGALEMGIPEKELPKLVRMWRNANKRIVSLWGAIELAVRNALEGVGTTYDDRTGLRVQRDPHVRGFRIDLPSGRALYYRNAKIRESDGHIIYEVCSKGAGATVVETYGGRLVENITQAVARDLLADAIVRIGKRSSYQIVAHVHDEVIAEVPEKGAEGHLRYLSSLMCEMPTWARSLPLAADGYLCKSYRKE